jgi:Ser/Thr protein kinase RdoA (MazF antagonist)
MSVHSAAVHAAGWFVAGTDVVRLETLGRGLINDTYLVTTTTRRFVLQRINTHVFPDPVAVMANMRRVTDHVSQLGGGTGIPRWQLPSVIPTLTGADVHCDEKGKYWRAISYIENTRGLDSVRNPVHATEVGRVLGRFHVLSSEIPPETLHDTLPGFHETPGYLKNLDAAVAACDRSRLSPDTVPKALEYVESRRDTANVLEAGRLRGDLRLRVIHGDPKLDNVLFDIGSDDAVSLIDLDTVKPGLIHYDIGDCLRSCCNMADKENGERQAAFDLDCCRAILRGYLAETRETLSPADQAYLYDAIRLLPFELGLRFLTDHLVGDVYFKVDWAGQNLSRALSQFQLARSVEAQADAIRRMLDQALNDG